MTAVKLQGTFKKDERPFNGLEEIADKLVKEAKTPKTYLVVAEVRSVGYEYHADDGTKTPKVKFEQIEVVLDDADAKIVKELLTRIYAARTGNEPQATLLDDIQE